MLIQRPYDVVIAGSRLSGLLMAAILNDKGVDVLLLDDEDTSEKTIDGFRLDMQMFHSSKLSDSPRVKEVLSVLDIDVNDRDLFHPSIPFFQVIAESHRLGFHGSRKDITYEFEREFPEEAQQILPTLWESVESREKLIHTLYNEKRIFYSQGIKARVDGTKRVRSKNGAVSPGSFQGKIACGGFSDASRKVLSMCLDYAIPLCPDNLKTGCFPFPLGNYKGYYPRGGMTGFKSHLKKRLKSCGVNIHPLSGIDSLIIRKRKVSGIITYGSYEAISTLALVYSSDLSNLPKLLPRSLFTKAFRDELEKNRRWKRWRSVFVAVDHDKIPVGMHDDLIFARDNGTPLVIQITPGYDEESVRGGMRLIKVSTLVEASKEDQTVVHEGYEAFEQSVMETLHKLMPFLDKSYEIIYRHDKDPVSKDDYVFRGHLQGPLNVGIVSPFTPYDNLFIAAREVMMTLGLEGDFIQAQVMANYVAAAVKKKGG